MIETNTNIKNILKSFRKDRGFNVEIYVTEKIKTINNFFSDQELDSAVIGISGGIDSAVTLFLLDRASKVNGSPLKKILPLSLPIRNVSGVTGQSDASKWALIVMDELDYKLKEINLTASYEAILDSTPYIGNNENRAWAEGQMASILRTPILYYHAAMLQTEGYKSIVVGTTNRDEGSYIGFFGKASDAMVDLQPIADIHKSEVYQVAKYLNIPDYIINRTPKGDVWDGRNDEQMIGATYDELEFFLLLKEYSSFDYDTQNLVNTYEPFINIEKLHQINKHKYAVGNPAHFIDVMPRKVPGGW